MVEKRNFLLLDEPTNHLDIMAREAVEESLQDFDGTLLVISHDRYFLDKVVDRVIEVRDRKLISYPGGFSDYWQARGEFRPKVVGRAAKRRTGRQESPSGSTSKRAPREVDRARAAIRKDLEDRITSAEQEKVLLEKRIAEAFTKHDRREGRRLERRLANLNTMIDRLYEKWTAEND
jgi:ATP-binding cassette subfamily F protein 3